jgi:UDPglucose--hexose-1-phosphate uridylyltransferase
VVVFAQDAQVPLGDLGTDRIALVLEVIGERTRALAAQGLRYVLPFENRGPEMGVTLHHPHGQIYAYGFLPGRQARALARLRAHHSLTGRDLVGDIAESALADGVHLLDTAPHALSLVPPFARFPFEVWIAPRRPAPDLASLSRDELRDVAAVLGAALGRLDGLWSRPMPYLMTINQAPTDGEPHPEWTVRIEIWPVRRAADKLKFLAGTELAAGVFAGDMLPEDAAARLRAVEVRP